MENTEIEDFLNCLEQAYYKPFGDESKINH